MANPKARQLEALLSLLPTWWKMRRDPDGAGQQFLNVPGLALDDVSDAITWAGNRTKVGTADLAEPAWFYRAPLPIIGAEDMKVQVWGNGIRLEEVDTVEHLLTAIPDDPFYDRGVQLQHPFLVDAAERTVYVRRPYRHTDDKPYGEIDVVLLDSRNAELVRRTVPLSLHPFFGALDEIGLLLGMPRLIEEENQAYQHRLLDCFRVPGGSHETGLAAGIGRQLNLVEQITWPDGGKPILLRRPHILSTSLLVDGEAVDATRLTSDDDGRVTIAGDAFYANLPRTVRFTWGVRTHSLPDLTEQLQTEMQIDDIPAPMLEFYVETIRAQIAAEWDQFTWGDSFWALESSTEDGGGRGCVPSFFDA